MTTALSSPYLPGYAPGLASAPSFATVPMGPGQTQYDRALDNYYDSSNPFSKHARRKDPRRHDTDRDGIPDAYDYDNDNDGIPDYYEPRRRRRGCCRDHQEKQSDPAALLV